MRVLKGTLDRGAEEWSLTLQGRKVQHAAHQFSILSISGNHCVSAAHPSHLLLVRYFGFLLMEPPPPYPPSFHSYDPIPSIGA